ncbi:MAG: hypothetical protein J5553_01955 [Verrucomicrobia bacterium]|nr:hypothetical protein [Verrucomicrobiota bacterium]
MKKSNGFATYDDIFGKCLHIKCLHIDSSRLDECMKYMYENNVKHIRISRLFYKEKDISFLDDLKDYLEGLFIDNYGYQYDVINTGYWAWKKLSELLPYNYEYE